MSFLKVIGLPFVVVDLTCILARYNQEKTREKWSTKTCFKISAKGKGPRSRKFWSIVCCERFRRRDATSIVVGRWLGSLGTSYLKSLSRWIVLVRCYELESGISHN
jgi:hypothetical protein